MFTSIRRLTRQNKTLTTLLLGVGSIAASFSLGLHTTGSVQPATLVEAGSTGVRGDINENGVLDIDDVRLILESAQGYRNVSAEDLSADFDGDGHLTVDDALRVIHLLDTF